MKRLTPARFAIAALLGVVLGLAIVADATAAPSYRELARKPVWTKADVRDQTAKACVVAKVPARHRDMLVRWHIDVVFEGRAESHGQTRLASNPPYLGLDQWSTLEPWRLNAREWNLAKAERHGHTRDGWRICGVCSTRRWVRCVRDHHYDMTAVRVHWPTLGR